MVTAGEPVLRGSGFPIIPFVPLAQIRQSFYFSRWHLIPVKLPKSFDPLPVVIYSFSVITETADKLDKTKLAQKMDLCTKKQGFQHDYRQGCGPWRITIPIR
jgi:hypothetical protein